MIESAMLYENELKSPLAALSDRIRRQPDKRAMVQPLKDGRLREYTWFELGEQAQKMANYLVSRNLAPGTHIALISENCAEWIMADLAIWMAGHVSVPLYATMTSESMHAIMAHSETRHAFIGKSDDWEKINRGLPEGVHCIAFELAPQAARTAADARWEEIMATQTPLSEWVERRDEEMATIIYTSGTSDTPKGVMHSFGALKAVGNRIAFAYELSADDRLLSYLPLAHVAERSATELGFLYIGLTLYFVESLATFSDDIKRARPTVFFAVPRIWYQFYQKACEHTPPEKLDRLLAFPIVGLFTRRRILASMGLDRCRIALCGAAAVSQTLTDWFRSLGLEILEGYGSTENLAWSHTTPEGYQRVGRVGTPNDSVECRLGEDGEILIKSPGSMMGYFKEERISRDAFIDGVWLRTGDVGEIDEDGYLRITGRMSDLYKTGKGMYVAPAPIEMRLVSVPGIAQACVMGEGLPQSIALIDLNDEQRAALARDEAATKSRLATAFKTRLDEINNQLNPHERLNALVVVKTPWTVENGTLTPTLKIKRNVLEGIYSEQLGAWEGKGGIVWE